MDACYGPWGIFTPSTFDSGAEETSEFSILGPRDKIVDLLKKPQGETVFGQGMVFTPVEILRHDTRKSHLVLSLWQNRCDSVVGLLLSYLPQEFRRSSTRD